MKVLFEESRKSDTDLIPNAIYYGQKPIRHGNRSLDALFKGIVDRNGQNEQKGLESGGGIRTRYANKDGSNNKYPAFIVIRNTKSNERYPNHYDSKRKELYYYGDNDKVGQDPIEKRRKGNKNIKRIFDLVYGKEQNLADKYICPIFYFESVTKGSEEQKFIGIAYPYIKDGEYIDAVKLVTHNNIDNFIFKFSIVEECVSKKWLFDLLMGDRGNSEFSPDSWDMYYSEVIIRKQ